MAYDAALADRIRDLLISEAGVTEMKAFGGCAFLVHGNIAVSASGQGGLFVRVDPTQFERLISRTSAMPFEMRGRKMKGWLHIDGAQVRTEPQLRKWVDMGTTYARTLPTKA